MLLRTIWPLMLIRYQFSVHTEAKQMNAAWNMALSLGTEVELVFIFNCSGFIYLNLLKTHCAVGFTVRYFHGPQLKECKGMLMRTGW